MASNCCDDDCAAPSGDRGYRKVLWVALGINLAMFAVEIVASIVGRSMSLRADALDFLGDAGNYIVALAVVDLSLRWRAGAALLKGVVMGSFGLWVAGSTFLHAITATVPAAEVMGAIGMLALVANLVVGALLYRHRTGDSQALSVWLCTRNDCLVNIAVLIAGAGVWASETPWPDIIVAFIIAGLSLSSAARIIRHAMNELRGLGPTVQAAE
jgi:Co/Zn/Cd efflux system component